MKKRKPAYVGSQGIKKTEAWRIFSHYIRQRDGHCISCGVRKHWKELDAGHFVAGNTCGKELYFSEYNVFAQCTGCNRFRHGNGSQYAIALVKHFGPDILGKIDQIRREEKEKGIICRFSKMELQEIEDKYKLKLQSLNG